MTKTPPELVETEDLANLRQRAEEKSCVRKCATLKDISPEETLKLLHELQVLQIELEMQNEELRLSQAELNAERARYFELYELAPVGYLTINNKGLIQEANLTVAAMLGVARTVLQQTLLSGFIFSQDLDAFNQYRKKLIETGESLSWELRMVRADGSIFWADMQASPQQNGECWLVLNDITVRKQAEEELRETKAILQAAMDQSLAGIAIADAPDGLLRYVNTAGLLIGNGDRQTLLEGISVDQYVASWQLLDLDGSPLKTDEVPLVRAILFGETCSREFIIRRANNDDRIVLANAAPIRNANDEVTAGIVVFMDITERKRFEEVQAFLAHSCSGVQGEPFFNSVASYLAQALGMDFVCIDRLEGDELNAQTVAVWCDGLFEDNISYALKDTPCGDLVGKEVCCFPSRVSQLFPRDQALQELQAESYIGVTLFDHTGQPIGLIAVIGRNPLANRPLAEAILKLVAVRAAGEMERLNAEAVLRESEERHRVILQTAMDGFWLVDMEGHLLDVNESYCRMSGYSVQELLTMRIADMETADTAVDAAAQIRKTMTQGEDCFESRLRRKDSRIIDVEISVQHYPTEGGRFVVFLHDITARKQADTYREMAREVLLVLNEPGNLHSSIQRVLAALKMRTGADAVGMRLQEGDDFPYFAQEGFDKDFLRTENSLINRSMDGGICRDKDSNVSLECTCGLVISGKHGPTNSSFTPGGSFWTNDSSPLLDIPIELDSRLHPRNECIHLGYASVALVPIRNTDSIVGLIQLNARSKDHFTLETVQLMEGIATHIGAALMRKQAEEEIERLNTDLASRAIELELANVDLEAFNYTISHDLRKPLSVINSYCQVVLEQCGNEFDEPSLGYIREIYEGTLRMNRLIDALLEFSIVSHRELDLEKVDLSAMANVAAAELQLDELERKVSFRIAPGVTTVCDAELLRVVLDNLIGNAWKYTGNSEEAIIEFGVTETAGKQVFFVKDNGPGFDMEYKDKMFNAFQRLPGTSADGHGIGLATVQRIILSHGGRVWAEGCEGKGATFCFTLTAD